MSFPNFPGVPALKSAPLAAVIVLGNGVLQKGLNYFKPQWGIYRSDGKTPAINPDSMLSVDYSNMQNISQYPVEQGSFTSFNKVQTPFRIIVKMAKGGTKASRQVFIKELEDLNDSLELFTIVTPERTYRNANVERYDITRSADSGAGMVISNVYFTEIREASVTTSTTQAKSPAAPSAQAMQSNGQIQPGASTAPVTGVQ